LYWLSSEEKLTAEQLDAIDTATEEQPLLVSGISLWEIATLCSLGRIKLALPLRDWLERAVAPPLVSRVNISPAIAAEVASLPETFHRDPADRILVATARVLNATLVTQDRRIIDSGMVATL
jgi:PIN domain nuclease of toxin-antitoxin system